MIISLLIITVYSLLAYALLIPYMGFYSEDFFFSYVSHFYGVDGLIESLSIDRPFDGYLLAFSYFIIGLRDNIFLWHVSTFLIRLMGGYALFFTLLRIWPNKLSIITLTTLLFLIYPGFLQQTLPLGYQVHIIGLTTWILSLMFTVLAIKSVNIYRFFVYTLMALILQALTFFNLEFFIGMEILRMLLVIFILNGQISFQEIKKISRYWKYCIPYLVSLTIFTAWRIFLFKSTRDVTNINWVTETYYLNFIWILKVPLEIVFSLLQTLIFAYFLPLVINLIRLPVWNLLLSLLIGFGSTILLFNHYKKIQVDSKDQKLGRELFLIGLISIIGTLLPIMLSGRFIRVYSVYDRYTVPSIIPVAFLIIGFLLFKFTNRARLIIFLLVGLSLSSHLMNGFYRVDYWNKQKELWWQLYWRAPNIEKNAMLILDFPPITEDVLFKEIINKVQWYRFYWAEEQIWTTGNLFFNYNSPPIDHFHGDFLRDKDILKKIKEKSVEEINNRNIIYSRDFKNSIIIITPSDTSCLKVLDGDKLVKAGPSITPPKHIFGSEPSHSWCYYFQKASLARQLKDWDNLSLLKEEVIKKNLKPKDPNEWLPFEKNLR